MTQQIRRGMVVRSGDGHRIGTVDTLTDQGFRLRRGPFAYYADVIEVRGDEVWVATHRPGLSDARQASPRR